MTWPFFDPEAVPHFCEWCGDRSEGVEEWVHQLGHPPAASILYFCCVEHFWAWRTREEGRAG
jgi:hypothetical protein